MANLHRDILTAVPPPPLLPQPGCHRHRRRDCCVWGQYVELTRQSEPPESNGAPAMLQKAAKTAARTLDCSVAPAGSASSPRRSGPHAVHEQRDVEQHQTERQIAACRPRPGLLEQPVRGASTRPFTRTPGRAWTPSRFWRRLIMPSGRSGHHGATGQCMNPVPAET